MGGEEPYCYRCRQTYGCICTGKQFTSAGDMLKEVESKLDASQKALRAFVAAAKSWHEMHRPIGTAAVQCDCLCECIPAGEEALK